MKIVRIVLGVLVAGGLISGATALLLWSNRPPAPVKSAVPAAPDSITEVTGRYLFNGTVTWARAVERDAHGNYSQPFSQLSSFHREVYDAWSTDFECPITKNVVPFQVQVDRLVFNCRPEFLPEAAKYFNLFDLANNHTDNQGGSAGLAETRQNLEQAGVQYFGNFDPSVARDVCEVVALPVHVIKSDKSQSPAALPVAMCAWHYFYRQPLPGEIEVMQRYAHIMPVFAFIEMGMEYHPAADALQQTIAHTVVDQGPEFVVANNPHWVQNTEVYKGKLIAYSLGNFIFDQIDSETQRSASIDASLSLTYDENVAKWLALAPKCKAFHDDCLTQAEQQNLTKPTINLKYSVIAGQGGAGKITHKADAATQQAVESRLNWAASMKALSQP